MGLHFLLKEPFNGENDTDCGENLPPFQLSYSDGELNGFVWHAIGKCIF